VCLSRPFAGEVGERSETGEGGARGKTLTRVASAPRPLPRRAGEVYGATVGVTLPYTGIRTGIDLNPWMKFE
jgi:hypothetical protein